MANHNNTSQLPFSNHLSSLLGWPAVDDQSYNRGKEGRAHLQQLCDMELVQQKIQKGPIWPATQQPLVLQLLARCSQIFGR